VDDLFLLCSDGLSDMLTDREMAKAIAAVDADPEVAAETLVKAANARGGEDNVTVVLFEMVSGEAAAEPAPDASEPESEADADQGPDTAEHFDPVLEDGGGPQDDEESTAAPRRFGAGPGGRLAALLVVAVVLGVGALALYVALKR
jgi:protein phosphatase